MWHRPWHRHIKVQPIRAQNLDGSEPMRVLQSRHCTGPTSAHDGGVVPAGGGGAGRGRRRHLLGGHQHGAQPAGGGGRGERRLRAEQILLRVSLAL